MAIDMSQFYQVFFEESAEHLAEMERLLLEMDVDTPDIEEMNAIFRAAHSIKGGSGTFGFTDMTEVTHVLENLLDRLRKGEIQPRVEMVDVFLEAADVLKHQLDCHIQGTNANTQLAEEVCQKLQALTQHAATAGEKDTPNEPPATTEPIETASAPDLAKPTPTKPAPTHHFDIVFHPDHAFLDRKHAIEDLVSELSRLGALKTLSEPEIAAPRKKKKKDKKSKKEKAVAPLVWHFQLSTPEPIGTVQDLFAFIAEPEEVEITAMAETSATSIPVETGDESYGFFDPLPEPTSSQDAQSDDPGYGFFEPLVVETTTDDPGYGFFEPLASASPPSDDPGYGFFTDLTSPAPATTVEDGDGYGFFAPIPQVVISPPPQEAPKPIAKPAEPAKAKDKQPVTGETTIRVGVERVDQLINLVGELVITQAMLAETASELDPILYERLHNGLGQLERNTRDLQESVMSIRMMPISFVFSRFPRVVRDLASKLNKQVELITIGENTELDKSLIEKLADPLTHLVRNSLDHGIETAEKRLASGKSAKGTITLSASNQGGAVVIEVTDDGAGLNRDRIMSKARENGLQVQDGMSDSEVWMLIFEPGFSTAEVVTDVSGRGVGMDVVRRNITEMGGDIQIASAAGIGTTMTIRLPLTLAILDGMSVALGNNVYVIPLNLIVETLQPAVEDLKTITGQGHMVHVRGEYLPIIALHRLFNMPTDIVDPCRGVLILIESDGKKAALFVDALVGQQQVVIKSLETNFRKVVGISGATIMGDGTVAMILDVPTLIKLGQGSI
jgi:two-component system chemotaxis sensor kinase CheA